MILLNVVRCQFRRSSIPSSHVLSESISFRMNLLNREGFRKGRIHCLTICWNGHSSFVRFASNVLHPYTTATSRQTINGLKELNRHPQAGCPAGWRGSKDAGVLGVPLFRSLRRNSADWGPTSQGTLLLRGLRSSGMDALPGVTRSPASVCASGRRRRRAG